MMPPILSTMLVVASVILTLLTAVLIRQNKMPIKYSVLWFLFSLLIFLVGITPDFISGIADFFGFQTISNFLLSIIVGMLALLSLALTTMIASQRHRIKLISQELSILKKEIQDVKRPKK